MHASVMAFGKRVIRAPDVEGKRVLEVGALDVNGSLQGWVKVFDPELYIGIDIMHGPGVDVVMDACELAERFIRPFDLVLCTETLEHIEDWPMAMQNMMAVTAFGGAMVLTTRSVGKAFHEYPHDYWRFDDDAMRKVFRWWHFEALEPDTQEPGVFVKAWKPDTPDEYVPVLIDKDWATRVDK